MRVTFWGTRGSIAKAGPSTVRYGGNTSCVEVETDGGTRIVIDCGTGAHGLGVDLMERSNGEAIDGHILISHTHWDHIQGLPFFAPLFQPGNSWHIYGPRGLGGSVIDALAGQMQYSYFPISIEQLAAQVDYHDLVDGSFEIDDVRVVTHYLNHPALSLGYRIEADGASVVYSSDHEPHDPALGAGGDLGASREDAAHVRFLDGADLVIHDAQYLAEEYGSKTGWGHSTVEYVVDAAVQAGVRQLALFHHDPTRDDDAVDEVVELARSRAAAAGHPGEIFAAAEGTTHELASDRPTAQRDRAHGDADRSPALDDMARSVLIAVRRPEIAEIVREAAEAEGLEIFETADASEALDLVRDHEPAIVVLEDDDDVLDRAKAIRAVAPSYGSDVSIVTITSSGARARADRQSLTDWIPWPFSAVYARTKMHASLLRRACRWEIAPEPDDEDARVKALHDLEILDTPREARFDRYTDLASELLDVPVALVSLVDSDRQWFKSVHGLDATETPREVSFCAHAILGADVFQVPDALLDDRFADNPFVSTDEQRIRFYAGVPLELSDGSPVGTLCVIDYRPRVLDDDQLDGLRDLGRQVSEELESSKPSSG